MCHRRCYYVRFILTVKVGGVPATNTLDFLYDTPVISRVTMQNQPCLLAVAAEASGATDDDSASQVHVRCMCTRCIIAEFAV
jgi:hypothetical protein